MSDRLPMLVLGGLVVVLVATGAGIALLLSGDKDEPKAADATRPSAPEPVTTSTTPDPAEPLPPAPRKRNRHVRGRVGTDGGVSFRVGALTTGVRSMPAGRLGDGRAITPRPGRRFAVVGVSYRSLSGKADPLCGNGAELILRRGRVEAIDGLYRIKGNEEVCSGGGRTGSAQVVFSVPPGARPRRLAIWNPAEPDVLGDSRLTFDLRR